MKTDTDSSDYIDDHRVYYRIKRRCFPVLAIVCLVLLVLLVVFIVLYANSAGSKPTSTPSVVPKPEKKYEICNNDRCFELGKAIVHSLNQSVDPCDDFYAFACGGWEKRIKMKFPNVSALNALSYLTLKNKHTLEGVLKQASHNYSKNEAVMKTVRFYNSCMNTTAIKSMGVQPLVDLIEVYGGCSVLNNTDSSVSIETRIGKANRELGVNSLIGASMTIDKYNSSNYILVMNYAQLTFPLSTYLNVSDKEQQYVKEKIQEFAQSLGINNTQSLMALMNIYNFETKLAQIQSGKTPDEELMESVKKSIEEQREITDHRMKMKDFCKKSGFSCPLLKRILKLSYLRDFTGEELVLVTNVTYFKNLYKLYQSTIDNGNEQVIIDYIMWRVVYKYLAVIKLDDSAVLPSSRSSHCINVMAKLFDLTLDLLYVDAKFDEKSKKRVEEMTNDLKQSFIDQLPQEDWMDSETQKQAKEKALAIKIFIGYPTFIKDPKKLAKYYQSLKVSDDYFANYKAGSRFLSIMHKSFYGKPVDRNSWLWLFDRSTYRANGFYSSNMNSITYLAGILQPPCYDEYFPSYMQYGAIGMVIGHELTHGFDSQGRQYDKNGNLRDWWSPSAASTFKKKASCLVDQYNKYKFHGMKVNGSLTINENIADNGGIKIAYDAYQRWASKNGTEKILPGLQLTPDQLFFVGFAQTWCGVFDKKGAMTQLKDTHSPGRYRVIGSLSNNEKFSEAFKCPVNSPMNPSKKCSVW